MKRGFTLVELLTVCAMIALLAGITCAVCGAARRYAQRAAHRAYVRPVSTMIEQADL